MSAADAIAEVTDMDTGRASRQLASVDLSGRSAAFSGQANLAFCGHRVADGMVAAGNILKGAHVLEAMLETFKHANGTFPQRLLAGLTTGEASGGDNRGTLSAALLHVGPDIAPLDLRIDCSQSAMSDLQALYERTREPGYAAWAASVPTATDPYRSPAHDDEPAVAFAVNARS